MANESAMLYSILSSAIPFSSRLQSFPATGSFPMCQLFASGGQSVGTLASASVLPMNIQGWFRIDWFDLFAVQGTLKCLLQHQDLKASILQCSSFFMVQLSHPYPTTGNTNSCLIKIQIFVSKNDVLVFFLIHCLVLLYLSFQGASLLISWLQSSSAVILEPKKTKFVTASTFPPSIYHKVMGLGAVIFVC